MLAVAKIGDTRVINVSRILEKDYDTAVFSPAYATFHANGTIDVTPAKRLQPSEP